MTLARSTACWYIVRVAGPKSPSTFSVVMPAGSFLIAALNLMSEEGADPADYGSIYKAADVAARALWGAGEVEGPLWMKDGAKLLARFWAFGAEGQPLNELAWVTGTDNRRALSE